MQTIIYYGYVKSMIIETCNSFKSNLSIDIYMIVYVYLDTIVISM